MLARIAEKRDAVVCPSIDIIDAQTLAYHGVGGSSVGGFWWSLHFSWRPIPQHEQLRRKSSTDPIRYTAWIRGKLDKTCMLHCWNSVDCTYWSTKALGGTQLLFWWGIWNLSWFHIDFVCGVQSSEAIPSFAFQEQWPAGTIWSGTVVPPMKFWNVHKAFKASPLALSLSHFCFATRRASAQAGATAYPGQTKAQLCSLSHDWCHWCSDPGILRQWRGCSGRVHMELAFHMEEYPSERKRETNIQLWAS